MSDPVNHPAHYGGKDNPYEVINVIEAWGLDFHLASVVKYVSRAGKKGDELEDLEKAQWFLERAIARASGVEREELNNAMSHLQAAIEERQSPFAG